MFSTFFRFSAADFRPAPTFSLSIPAFPRFSAADVSAGSLHFPYEFPMFPTKVLGFPMFVPSNLGAGFWWDFSGFPTEHGQGKEPPNNEAPTTILRFDCAHLPERTPTISLSLYNLFFIGLCAPRKSDRSQQPSQSHPTAHREPTSTKVETSHAKVGRSGACNHPGALGIETWQRRPRFSEAHSRAVALGAHGVKMAKTGLRCSEPWQSKMVQRMCFQILKGPVMWCA